MCECCWVHFTVCCFYCCYCCCSLASAAVVPNNTRKANGLHAVMRARHVCLCVFVDFLFLVSRKHYAHTDQHLVRAGYLRRLGRYWKSFRVCASVCALFLFKNNNNKKIPKPNRVIFSFFFLYFSYWFFFVIFISFNFFSRSGFLCLVYSVATRTHTLLKRQPFIYFCYLI